MISEVFKRYIIGTARPADIGFFICMEIIFEDELASWIDSAEKLDFGGAYGVFPGMRVENQVVFNVDYTKPVNWTFALIEEEPLKHITNISKIKLPMKKLRDLISPSYKIIFHRIPNETSVRFKYKNIPGLL